MASFSPRNGEVILKINPVLQKHWQFKFQSPQWGSNSKEKELKELVAVVAFQSPQWGSNSKVALEMH